MLALAECLRYDAVVTVEDKESEPLLSGPYDEELSDVLADLCDPAEIRESIEHALYGDDEAATVYVEKYATFAHELLKTIADSGESRSLVRSGNGQFEVQDETGARGGWLEDALEQSAAEAPFSSWSAELGMERGILVHVLALLRDMLPDAEPLEPPGLTARRIVALSHADTRRFFRAIRRSLDTDEPALERTQRLFGLSLTELGRLFGVSRQGVSDWMARGIPAERQDKVATVAAIADLLEHKLKTDRIPGIARRQADAYRGRTMLELIAEDRQRELLELTRQSFDWANAA